MKHHITFTPPKKVYPVLEPLDNQWGSVHIPNDMARVKELSRENDIKRITRNKTAKSKTR